MPELIPYAVIILCGLVFAAVLLFTAAIGVHDLWCWGRFRWDVFRARRRPAHCGRDVRDKPLPPRTPRVMVQHPDPVLLLDEAEVQAEANDLITEALRVARDAAERQTRA